MSVLTLENISFKYEDDNIIEDISLTLDNNEIISILGESGSGKTTLFNVIAGILTPQSGTMKLEDEILTSSNGKISYMMQKDLLLPFKTIEENVALPLILKGHSKKDALSKVQPLFDTFGLSDCQHKYPNALSGGMRQRAALLRTYMQSCSVALLDEPFSALDPLTKRKMHSWYLDIMSSIDLPTLFITHDVEEAIFLSDKIYILKGKPAKLIGPITLKANTHDEAFLLSEEFLEIKRMIFDIL